MSDDDNGSDISSSGANIPTCTHTFFTSFLFSISRKLVFAVQAFYTSNTYNDCGGIERGCTHLRYLLIQMSLVTTL